MPVQRRVVSLPAVVDVALPFYGDILDSYTKEMGIPLTSEISARGSGLQEEFLVFQAQVAEQVRLGAGITDAQVDAEYGSDPQPRGPLNWKWVQAIGRSDAQQRLPSGTTRSTHETLWPLYPLDASNFPVSPAIENNSAVKNHTDNRHGIAGYLDDATAAKRICNLFVS